MKIEEEPKLIQTEGFDKIRPRDHKAKIVLWSDLTVSDLDVVDEVQAPDHVKQTLANIFKVEDYKDNLKNGILVDLFYYCIQFSRDNSFSKEQTSAFFSIVKKTHEVCVETPFGNVENCFRYFKELVLCHAVKRPPYSIDLFSPDEVRKITEYVINTYFRHFKMYKYVFTPLVRLDLSMNYIGMPPTPPASEVDEADQAADGELTERSNKDGEQGADGETGSEAQGDGELVEKSGESAAASELRQLIKQHLSEEIKKLKISMEDQIKESEDSISKKLDAAEDQKTSGKASAGKKKK